HVAEDAAGDGEAHARGVEGHEAGEENLLLVVRGAAVVRQSAVVARGGGYVGHTGLSPLSPVPNRTCRDVRREPMMTGGPADFNISRVSDSLAGSYRTRRAKLARLYRGATRCC